jgi:transketolase
MKALRDVFGDTLVSLGSTNPNVVVLDADLANSTKADKFAKMYPGRFLQMGIAEQNFVGVAVGLASLGYVPWLSTFTVFFTHRALDPIRMLVAQTHANVKIGAAYAGLLTGLTGKTHHDVQDIAIMRAMPDMTVVAPADAIEGEAIIRWATEYEGPVYVRLARDASPNVFDEQYRFVPGKTISLKEGSDVLLISTGPQSVRCLQAAELLHGQGISAGVLHVPSIKPVNKEEIVSAAEKAKVVVTVEEHTIYGGWAVWWRKFYRKPRRGGSSALASRIVGASRRLTNICWTCFNFPRLGSANELSKLYRIQNECAPKTTRL